MKKKTHTSRASHRPARPSLDGVVSFGLNRRAFLRGAGGALLGLPFLELTAARSARAQSAGAPRRLLIISLGHSMDIEGSRDNAHLLPPHQGGVLTGMSPVLQALEPHRAKVSYLQGIDNLVSQRLSSNGHNGSGRTLLAYAPHAGARFEADGSLASSQSGASVGQIVDGPSMYPTGPSVNYFIASALGQAPLNLRVGGDHGEHARDFYESEGAGGSTTILRDPCNPDPASAFDRLFGQGGGGAQAPTSLERLRARRGSVLDAVLGGFNRLRNEAGAEDRVRLDNHASVIRDIEAAIGQQLDLVCEDPTLTLPDGMPQSLTDGNGRFDHLIAEAQLGVVATAFACQATSVAHLHFSNIQSNKFPFLNGGNDMFPGTNWHAVVHHDNGDGPQAVADRLKANQWYAQVLADTISRFEGISDGSGSLMDNTLIVWISSLRYSSHSTSDLPIVLAGDLGGQLRTGRFFNLREFGAGGATLGDFWTSICNIMLSPSLANGWDEAPVSAFGFNRGTFNAERPFHNGNLPGLLASG